MESFLRQARDAGDSDSVADLTHQLDQVREPPVTVPRAAWLRGIYLRLSNRRSSSMNGPEPIQFSEIAAFLTLHQLTLESWEIQLLETMDIAFLQSINIPE
ncbi:phage tail assembly chaperone [Leptothrix discophora]